MTDSKALVRRSDIIRRLRDAGFPAVQHTSEDTTATHCVHRGLLGVNALNQLYVTDAGRAFLEEDDDEDDDDSEEIEAPATPYIVPEEDEEEEEIAATIKRKVGDLPKERARPWQFVLATVNRERLKDLAEVFGISEEAVLNVAVSELSDGKIAAVREAEEE